MRETCNHVEIVRDGRSKNGSQRYKCKSCGHRPTTRRYLITSAQNDTPVHRGFWGALKTYAAAEGATLQVIPTRYRNPDSHHEGIADEMSWPAEVLPYLVDRDVKVHPHLMLMGDAKINATASDPLSGMDSLSGGRSAVYGHAQVQMRLVPTPRHDLPRILHTTGSCSVPNYSRSKAGKKALFHHSIGALVVETCGNRFHLRELLGDDTGAFYDLTKHYSVTGVTDGHSISALVLGDEHVKFMDAQVHRATFGTGGIVETLRPQVLVRHDMHDHYSGSHHHENDTLLKVAKAHAGDDCVESELNLLRDHIAATTPPGSVSAIVQSNHHDHLRQWINRFDAKRDPGNALFAWELYGRLAQAIRNKEDADPFRVWLKANLPNEVKGRVEFLDPDRAHLIGGVDVSQHGDKGPNGSRPGIAGFARLTHKMFLGHSHTPGIKMGAWQVGVSAPGMGYASGLSSWLATHGVIYPSGKRAMLHIIGGHWHG